VGWPLTHLNKELIIKAIQRVCLHCRSVPGALLTEDDLKCLLVSELLSLEAFSRVITTQDTHISATPVHMEVKWFDAAGKLTIQPDITILDPEQLSLLHRVGSLKAPPSKQFHFTGSAFIFELKFARGKHGITDAELRRIRKDFEKIEKLFAKLKADSDENNVFCFFVVFARYRAACSAWGEFLHEHSDSDHWKLIYKPLDVPPPESGPGRGRRLLSLPPASQDGFASKL